MREEWEAYKSAVDESGILNKTVWLDLPGNHGKVLIVIILLDSYNIYGIENGNPYFKYVLIFWIYDLMQKCMV